MEMRSWKWQERDAWFQQVLQVCLSLDIKCMSCMFVPLQELDNFILLLYNNVLVTWSWSQKQESKGCVVRYIWIVMLVSNLLSYTTLCLGYNLLTHKPTCIVVPKGNHDVGRFRWRKLTFTNIYEETGKTMFENQLTIQTWVTSKDKKASRQTEGGTEVN